MAGASGRLADPAKAPYSISRWDRPKRKEIDRFLLAAELNQPATRINRRRNLREFELLGGSTDQRLFGNSNYRTISGTAVVSFSIFSMDIL
jgi:hypothetical protein